MIEVKQSTSVRVPVYLATSAGAAVAGVAAGSITASIMKSDGTVVNLTVDGTNWSEVTSGAFANKGVYTLTLSTSNTNTTGLLVYIINSSAGSAQSYRGALKVVANEEADTKAVVDTINTTTASTNTIVGTINTTTTSTNTTVGTINTNVNTANTGITAANTALTNLQTDMDDVQSKALDLHDAQFGKWQVFTSGPDANRLVLYRADGTTVLKKFDLVDANGDATFADFFKRTPV